MPLSTVDPLIIRASCRTAGGPDMAIPSSAAGNSTNPDRRRVLGFGIGDRPVRLGTPLQICVDSSFSTYQLLASIIGVVWFLRG